MAEKITSLRQALWNSADQLRGQMDANDYKTIFLDSSFINTYLINYSWLFVII